MNIEDVIISEVKRHFGVDFFIKTRQRKICFPRQVCMMLLSERTHLGLANIGKLFNSHHTTVIHARHTVKNLMDSDEDIRRQVTELESRI